MASMHRLLAILGLLLVALVAAGAPVASAQGNPGAIKVTSSTAATKFAEELKFALKAESSAGSIEKVDLFYTFGDGKATNRVPTEFTPGKSVTATATKRAQQGEFAPQLDIRYYWRITDSAGNTLKTDPQTVVYSDDRFQWQKAGNDRATVQWYGENDRFGQQALNWTVEGLDRLEQKFGIQMSYPANVVIYKSKDDMSKSLAPRGATFDKGATVLGEARSAYGTLLMLNQGDARTTLWHELSHLVLHDLVKGPYESNLPAWLDEGLAMYNESDDANDNYQRALDDAIRKDDVFTVRSMTAPNGVPTKVGIWYGQARSIVRYLLDEHGGRDNMLKLIQLLASGTRTDPALQQVYGFDQNQLNNLWRAAQNLPVTAPAPVAPPSGQGAAPAATPVAPSSGQSAPPVATPRASAGQAAAPTAAPVRPAPADAQPSAAPVGPSRGVLLAVAAFGLALACLTVLVAGFGVLAFAMARRR